MNRILIVDDEPVILSMLKKILAREDRIFVTAESAVQALRLAREMPSVEVALVDKNLPDRTGLDVARELKHLHTDIEVILLTAYASLDSAIEAVKVGAFDYIQKPLEDFDDLSLKVQNAAEKVRLKREQRRLLDRYAESEERYRGVFQASSDAIIVCDAQSGMIHDANLAAQRLYGYSSQEFSQVTVSALGVPLEMPQESNGVPLTQFHTRRDGSRVPVEVSYGQFVFQKKVVRILAVRDTAERGRAEEERRMLERQLRHAQKMDAIGRLAGGIAHDFNNLLTVVVGNGELLANELGEGDKRTERAREILQAAQRGASLTRQLLGFSRKKAAKLEPVDLNQVVADFQKILRRTIGENIELTVIPSPDLGYALADADQMGQVLLNLALNARDAMGSCGELVIETSKVDLTCGTATLQSGLAPGHYVMLAVSDNGSGMPKEVLDRLFEPFFTTKEPGKGTGLGLATVYAIVRQAGGAVRVYSKTGMGTTFKVYLPLLSKIASKPEKIVQSLSVRKGQGETILVAEDESGVRNVICQVLQRNGYGVLQASNGKEALELAVNYNASIHLLLADIVMPYFSGRDLANMLSKKKPEIPVLYMSAYAEKAAYQHGLVQASEMFLQKPFNEETLLRKIGQMLELNEHS